MPRDVASPAARCWHRVVGGSSDRRLPGRPVRASDLRALRVPDARPTRYVDAGSCAKQLSAKRTGTCRRPDRAPDPACAPCRQRASGQRSGRWLMRAKRRAPISCRHRCRRKNRCLPISVPGSWNVGVRRQSSGLSLTSRTKRVGWHWPWKPCFGASQGQFQGQFSAAVDH